MILYISYLKKEEWLWNLFLIILSYTLLVIIDNLTHFAWNIVGFNLSIHWPIYMLTDYPIFFVICKIMSKKVVEIKDKKFLPLSSRILSVLGAELILCMLIFVMHITVVEQAGASAKILLTSIILYIAYVTLTFLITKSWTKERFILGILPAIISIIGYLIISTISKHKLECMYKRKHYIIFF